MTHIDTADIPPGEREEFVRAVLSGGAVPVEVEHLPRGTPAIDLRLDSVRFGPLTVHSLWSSAMTSTRTARRLREESPPSTSLIVQCTGSGTVIQESREAAVGTGDLVVASSTQPSVIISGHHSRCLVVQIPAPLLAVPEATLLGAVARRVSPEVPIAGVLGRFVRDLATLPTLEAVEAEDLARPTVELVRALIATVLGDKNRPRESLQSTLQALLTDYISAHWHERDLTVSRLAAAHHLSPRHVYRLLSAQGISLGDWLRERRLEACRDELARPGAATDSIASVGRRWGFLDATNFGRAFKAAYGLTPLEWRLLQQDARQENRTSGRGRQAPAARTSGTHGRSKAPSADSLARRADPADPRSDHCGGNGSGENARCRPPWDVHAGW